MKNGLWRFNLTSHAKEYFIGDRVDYDETDNWCLFAKQVKNYTHGTGADIDGIMAWMFAAEKAREFRNASCASRREYSTCCVNAIKVPPHNASLRFLE